MQTGELNQRARRPSTPGANTQVLFNNGGVDGADANLTFDKANNILAIGGLTNTTPYILNHGRGTISIQGSGTQNDALVMFQNSTGFVGGYVYASNSEMRVVGESQSQLTLYAGGGLAATIDTSKRVGINTAPTGAPLTVSGGTGTEALRLQGGDAPYTSFYYGGAAGSGGRMGYIQFFSNTSAYFATEQNIPIEFRCNNIKNLQLNVNQANVNGSMNVTATGGGGTKVLEVNGANSSGPLCVFDSGGNFGTYMSYRANSADIAYIGSGNRVFASRNNDFAIAAVNVGGNLMLGVGSTCYVNLTAAQMNVTGNINVTANISNTGNLLVTQNTFTGNLSVTTLANIATLNVSVNCNVAALNVSGIANHASSMNVVGVIAAIGSPLSNTATRAVTGLAAISQSGMAITSNTTLSTDLNLQCTINETGVYKIDGFMGFYHTTSAIANVKITLGGTATINNMMMGIMASSGVAGAANLVQSNTATAGNTGLAQANANVQIANITSITQNQPDFVVLSGVVVVNGTGTLFPMWAQATSATSAMNRSANSYFSLRKIG